VRLGVALAAVGLTGCAARADKVLVLPEMPRLCGVVAAMGPGRKEGWRENPPACALPDVAAVALSCAVHDLVTAPDYTAIRDADGEITGPLAPEYRVAGLQCRFTDPDHRRAHCDFALTTPDGRSRAASTAFEHRFWADHGPTDHMYGTRWSPVGSCLASTG
jgi:hypothetical protein